MKIFVTGASGFIGFAVTKELISAGHEVIGLVRSDKSAGSIAKAGATSLRGSLEDLDSLRKGAGESDGVINLGFNHDFSQFGTSVQAEAKAIETMREVLKGTGRRLVIASGGPTLSEKFDENVSMNPRQAIARKVLEFAQQNVRSAVVRLPPTVHDETNCNPQYMHWQSAHQPAYIVGLTNVTNQLREMGIQTLKVYDPGKNK